MTQQQALDILKTGANVFLTGEPGSGKTHTVNRYVAELRKRGIEPALTASTGIAATHISGMTIHSWCGIGIKDRLTADDLARIAKNERVSRRVLKARVLIIDEVSMLDAGVFAMAEAAVRAVRKNHLPFGGLQVVVVGDFFQLPPVSRPGARAAFAFHSDAWAKLKPVTCYLSGQYRQDDDDYSELLAAIRGGAVERKHVDVLATRAIADADGEKERGLVLFPRNSDVDRINDAELTRLRGEMRSFEMASIGPAPLIETLVRGCLSPATLALKRGAAVMFTRNSPQGSFVNGTLGKVAGFDADTGYPIVETKQGILVTAEPMEWRIEDQGAMLASISQVPLRLAWAITVHKSQGMSLDAATMDLRSAFEYGQGYVALSRVRRLSGLRLLGYNARALEVHPDMLVRDRDFRGASQGAVAEYFSGGADGLTSLHEQFFASCGGKVAGAVVSAAASSSSREGKMYAKWTADEEQALVAMFRDGASLGDMATKLGRKEGGIMSRLKKLGVTAQRRADAPSSIF